MLEGLVIAVGGGVLGVALGAVPSWLLETRGISLGEEVTGNMSTNFGVSSTIYADFTWETALQRDRSSRQP